ncbi:hypothetical protein D3C87_06700 [compost metagenome]
MRKRITIFLSSLIALSSCSVERRLYSKGLHVEFRKPSRGSDSHHQIQSLDEPEENEPEKISSDSIINIPVQEKKENLISDSTNEKMIPAIKSIFWKSKIKPAVNRIRTGISIETHFSESLMSKSLKKNQYKHSVNKSRDFDWGEFFEWVLIIGGVIGFIFLLASMPGVTFVQALIGVLVVILIIFLLGLLISSALGNIEWFWSGR